MQKAQKGHTMLERIKVVECVETGLEYHTLMNERAFYSNQLELIEQSRLFHLATIKDLNCDCEQLYSDLGTQAFAASMEFYNYICNVTLYAVKKFAVRQLTNERESRLWQELEEVQSGAYVTTLSQVKALPEWKPEWRDFNFTINSVVNRIVGKVSYAVHRQDMSFDFNLTEKDNDGNTRDITLVDILTQRDNYTALQITRTENVAIRAEKARQQLESLGRYLDSKDADKLNYILQLKEDKVPLTATERKQYSRLIEKLRAEYAKVKTAEKREAGEYVKSWVELLNEQKAQAKVKKVERAKADAQRTATTKAQKAEKALANLNANKAQALNRIGTYKERLQEYHNQDTHSVETLKKLDWRLSLLAKDLDHVHSQPQLKAWRKLLNSVSYDMQGIKADSVQALHTIHKQAKALTKGLV